MKKGLSRSIVTIVIAIVLVVALSITTFANTFTYAYRGSSCKELIGQKKGGPSYNLLGTEKTEITVKWYGGSDYFHDWHSITDSYYHEKGNVDISTTGNVSRTHTFKASFSVGIEGIFGASSEYAMSLTTERSVTHSIAKNLASGFYYYGARARSKDMLFKVITNTYWKSYNGEWHLKNTATKNTYGCMLYDRRYYAWVRDY